MTTELLLNLTWLLIASGLVAVWRIRWIPQRDEASRRRLHEWSAIALALVLLFFAVSMSDDMHAEIVALEESSANRRDQVHICATHDPAVSPAASRHSAWLVAPSSPSTSADSLAFTIRLANPRSPADRSTLAEGSRAPPLSLL